ncbi:MAG TPA: YdcF family protein [Nakamurella sp.]|jgi:uncharacterized SAM-binding protein YcdF (DUF218 family)|nr:YdcF family protein [Nakamurella sp.]
MRLGRALLRLLAGAVLVMVLVTAGIVLRIVQFGATDQHAAADAIVVLGAAQYNGRPSEVFAARLDHAAELYRAGDAGHVVTIGGGQPGDAVTEGQAGRDYLAEHGLPDAALLAVGTGNDTVVSLRAAAAQLLPKGWTSVIVVTDPWHSARARMIARDVGLTVQVSPVTSGPATDRSVALRYIARETLGILFYRFTGGSSGAGTPVL